MDGRRLLRRHNKRSIRNYTVAVVLTTNPVRACCRRRLAEIGATGKLGASIFHAPWCELS